MPDITALMLNKSNESYNNAKKLFSETLEFCGSNPRASVSFIVKNDQLQNFFDYIENIMGSYIFAYSSIEHFANSLIPDEYVYKIERTDKKCTEYYNKDQVERNLSLKIKISEVLKHIYKSTDIKTSQIWNDFKKLEEVRHKIIHLKSSDSHKFKPEKSSLWKDLVPVPINNPAVVAKKIIGFYIINFKNDDIPRWYKKCPF